MPLFEAKNIVKQFGSFTALDNVSVQFLNSASMDYSVPTEQERQPLSGL